MSKSKGKSVSKNENLFDIIDRNIASKYFVGGLGRLLKDGSIVRLNGQIFERRTTKSGNEVILLNNFLGKPRKGTSEKWQLILVDNIVALNENLWRHSKAG